MIWIILLLIFTYISIAMMVLLFEDQSLIGASIFGILVIIGFVGVCKLIDEPRAIDVYRNKTELRITYEGGVPVDSVVIYKK